MNTSSTSPRFGALSRREFNALLDSERIRIAVSKQPNGNSLVYMRTGNSPEKLYAYRPSGHGKEASLVGLSGVLSPPENPILRWLFAKREVTTAKNLLRQLLNPGDRLVTINADSTAPLVKDRIASKVGVVPHAHEDARHSKRIYS
ncbi:MAG: hypothetical protein IPK79_05215 [Vampirovibrionales bacterium]|nr:hypothetical protein [Vampirovibrionales bacterium]